MEESIYFISRIMAIFVLFNNMTIMKRFIPGLIIVLLTLLPSCTEKEQKQEPKQEEKEVILTGISLNKASLDLIVGDTETLTASPNPANAKTKGTIAWSSTDTQVASVEDGKVTALKIGTTTVKATVDGFSASCNVTVNKPPYQSPSFQETDVTGKYKAWAMEDLVYSSFNWYDVLSAQKKKFIYPHILVSYVTMEWYKAENLEYIISGETPFYNTQCENVGRAADSDFKIHADHGYQRIISLAPTATIKGCGGGWEYVKEYIDQHPEKLFMVSTATGKLAGKTIEILQASSHYSVFKDLLNRDNFIFSGSIGDIDYNPGGDWITLHESIILNEMEEGKLYQASSVNSQKYNSFAVTAFDPDVDNITGLNNASNLALGFDGQKNLVVGMTSLYRCYNTDRCIDINDTCSSYPTASFSATLGNFLSILMKTHPGVTLVGASEIMREKYFRAEKMKYVVPETIQYVDLVPITDGLEVKEGENWHFIKTDEFLASEILHKDAVDEAFSSSAQEIDLPSSGGLCYFGPGIQFTIDGSTYEMTESNRSALVSAISAGKDVKWTFSRTVAKTYATGSADVTIRVIDHSGSLIPDIKRTVSVGI